jgi:hypothetical protein
MGDEPRPEAAIGLAELIVAVRDELEKADTARLDRADDALLELREVELELQFEVHRARPGRGGLGFRVLSAGAPAGDDRTGPGAAPAHAQRLRVLYGPAFKLVGLDEGGDGVPDWLRAPGAGSGAGTGSGADGPDRLEIDDDLGGLGDIRDAALHDAHPGTGPAPPRELGPDRAGADTSDL